MVSDNKNNEEWSNRPLAEAAETLFRQVNTRSVELAREYPEGSKKIIYGPAWATMEQAIEAAVAANAPAAFEALANQYSERADAFFSKWEEKLNAASK